MLGTLLLRGLIVKEDTAEDTTLKIPNQISQMKALLMGQIALGLRNEVVFGRYELGGDVDSPNVCDVVLVGLLGPLFHSFSGRF